MEKYEIEKLRQIPIEEVAGRLGLRVTRHKCLCPFHDDHHASLSFSQRRNSCRCFVCMQQGMGNIDLVMRLLNLDFPKACRWLADAGNVYLGETPPTQHSPLPARHPAFPSARYLRFFEHPWLSGEAQRFLFEERRIDPRVARWCRLTSWQDHGGTHWLQIPYFSTEGELIGVQNRNLDYGKPLGDSGTENSSAELKRNSDGKESLGTDDTDYTEKAKENPWESTKTAGEKNPCNPRNPCLNKTSNESTESAGEKNPCNPCLKSPMEQAPRFRFPRGSKCGIYNLPIVNRLREGDELYITEGCSDCWAMLSSGRKAIAIPSATLLSPEDRRLLLDLDRRLHLSWHMYPDRDAPGERLFMQLRELLPQLHHHQLPPGCKDFGEGFVKVKRLFKGKKVKR